MRRRCGRGQADRRRTWAGGLHDPAPDGGGGEAACANCHSSDGTGGFGPDLHAHSDPEVLQHHAQGAGKHAPGIKFPTLTDEDFEDIAAYLAEVAEDLGITHDDDVHDHG